MANQNSVVKNPVFNDLKVSIVEDFFYDKKTRELTGIPDAFVKNVSQTADKLVKDMEEKRAIAANFAASHACLCGNDDVKAILVKAGWSEDSFREGSREEPAVPFIVFLRAFSQGRIPVYTYIDAKTKMKVSAPHSMGPSGSQFRFELEKNKVYYGLRNLLREGQRIIKAAKTANLTPAAYQKLVDARRTARTGQSEAKRRAIAAEIKANKMDAQHAAKFLRAVKVADQTILGAFSFVSDFDKLVEQAKNNPDPVLFIANGMKVEITEESESTTEETKAKATKKAAKKNATKKSA